MVTVVYVDRKWMNNTFFIFIYSPGRTPDYVSIASYFDLILNELHRIKCIEMNHSRARARSLAHARPHLRFK